MQSIEPIVVVTSSGNQYLGYERDGMFYPTVGEPFSSNEIATSIKREYSIYAE